MRTILLLIGFFINGLGCISFLRANDASPPAADAASREKIATEHKLQTIIIDKLNLDRLDPKFFAACLTKKSKELDSEHRGVHVICLLTGPDPVPSIRNGPIHETEIFHVEDAPLRDVLDYYCQAANGYFHNSKAHYRIKGNSVVLSISTAPDLKP